MLSQQAGSFLAAHFLISLHFFIDLNGEVNGHSTEMQQCDALMGLHKTQFNALGSIMYF